jgi:hypothetical protein
MGEFSCRRLPSCIDQMESGPSNSVRLFTGLLSHTDSFTEISESSGTDCGQRRGVDVGRLKWPTILTTRNQSPITTSLGRNY